MKWLACSHEARAQCCVMHTTGCARRKYGTSPAPFEERAICERTHTNAYSFMKKVLVSSHRKFIYVVLPENIKFNIAAVPKLSHNLISTALLLRRGCSAVSKDCRSLGNVISGSSDFSFHLVKMILPPAKG